MLDYTVYCDIIYNIEVIQYISKGICNLIGIKLVFDNMKRFFSSSCMTGHTAEEEILGCCKVSWDGKTYFRFKEAMDMARKCQPFDPSCPSLEGARILHGAVAKALRLVDATALKLFTSINTPLDRFHGVDGWFEFEGKIITIDLTLQEQKDHARANFVVHAQELDFDFAFIAETIAQGFRYLSQPSATGRTSYAS